jgi:hypothetical protein
MWYLKESYVRLVDKPSDYKSDIVAILAKDHHLGLIPMNSPKLSKERVSLRPHPSPQTT